jgi:hypothetical protein
MTIEALKEKIEEYTQGIYKSFVFNDINAFLNTGITDKYINLFYIRPLLSAPNKYIVNYSDHAIKSKTKYRLVVQNNKKFSNVKETFLNLLLTQENVTLLNYTDDTEGVYDAEYNDKEVIREFDLLLFDFELETYLNHSCTLCECIQTIEC